MTRAERADLARLAGLRAKQAKAEAAQREKVLLAEVEDLFTAEFEARDAMWADAVAIAEEAARKANEVIVARCADLGIPARHAPVLTIGWKSRSAPFADPVRRAELRRLAQAKLTALTTTAKTIIDGKLLDTQTELIAGSLESDQALAFLAAMPTAEQLMPSLSLDDLGVKHWQPPEGVASMLVTPSTTADRKRRKVLRLIESSPGLSNRQIAQLADCDHKTVARYRSGELPAGTGELPTDSGGAP